MKTRINGCVINLSTLTDDELAALVDSITARERDLQREVAVVIAEANRRLALRLQRRAA